MRHLILAVLATFCLSAMQAHAQPDKVGYVDVDAVLEQLPEVAALRGKIEGEFSADIQAVSQQENQLQALMNKRQRDMATLSNSERQALDDQILKAQDDYTVLARRVQVGMQQRLLEEEGKLRARIQAAIETVRAEQGYAMVFRVDGLLAADAASDLSPLVLAKLTSQ